MFKINQNVPLFHKKAKFLKKKISGYLSCVCYPVYYVRLGQILIEKYSYIYEKPIHGSGTTIEYILLCEFLNNNQNNTKWIIYQ